MSHFEKKPPGYQPEQEPTSCTVLELYTFRGLWTRVDRLNATLRSGMHVRCGERRWRIEKMHVFAVPLEGRKYQKAGLLLSGPGDAPKPGDVLEFDETLRCHVTSNPCGTDTWMVGSVCPCPACTEWLCQQGSR